jgi:Fic family protein
MERTFSMWPDNVKNTPIGSLEPTEAYERVATGGRAENRLAQGWAFRPSPLPPHVNRASLLDELQSEHESAIIAVSTLKGAALACPFRDLLVAPLLNRDAVTSSRIENTIATPREVAMVAAGQAPKRHEALEVFNYTRALRHGLQSPLPICMRLVKEMHTILMEGVRGGDGTPGIERNVQNWIGSDEHRFASARFVPPKPGDTLRECLKNLEQYWNGESSLYAPGTRRLPALIEIAIAHYQFECIHPFGDGNGRLGRAVAAMSLVRSGLIEAPLVYVSGYFDTHRQRYYDLLLRLSETGNWGEWCRFFLEAVAVQAQDAMERVHRITSERERMLHELGRSRASTRIIRLMDHLIKNLTIDVNTASSLLDVTIPTARGDIKKLEQSGFLEEMTGTNYGQFWGARPIFEIIDPSPEPLGKVSSTRRPDAPPTEP